MCPRIGELLSAGRPRPLQFDIVTMVDKKRLITGCGPVVRTLLATGCERVMILWDENPPWTVDQDIASQRCWSTERRRILENLAIEQLELSRVGLVCIEREFESWLLFDARLIRAVLKDRAPWAEIRIPKHPDRHDRPKSLLISAFGKAVYNSAQTALQFRNHLRDLKSLRRCSTFQRFEGFCFPE